RRWFAALMGSTPGGASWAPPRRAGRARPSSPPPPPRLRGAGSLRSWDQLQEGHLGPLLDVRAEPARLHLPRRRDSAALVRCAHGINSRRGILGPSSTCGPSPPVFTSPAAATPRRWFAALMGSTPGGASWAPPRRAGRARPSSPPPPPRLRGAGSLRS